MKLADLTNLYRTVSDCVSVYATKPVDWDAIEKMLVDLDVGWNALEQLQVVVDSSMDVGAVAAFFWPNLQPVAFDLLVPPAKTVVKRDRLPYAAPLLEIAEISVPHIVVTLAETYADIVQFPEDGEPEQERVTVDANGDLTPVVQGATAAVASVVGDLAVVVAPDIVRASLVDRMIAAVPIACTVAPIDPTLGPIEAVSGTHRARSMR